MNTTKNRGFSLPIILLVIGLIAISGGLGYIYLNSKPANPIITHEYREEKEMNIENREEEKAKFLFTEQDSAASYETPPRSVWKIFTYNPDDNSFHQERILENATNLKLYNGNLFYSDVANSAGGGVRLLKLNLNSNMAQEMPIQGINKTNNWMDDMLLGSFLVDDGSIFYLIGVCSYGERCDLKQLNLLTSQDKLLVKDLHKKIKQVPNGSMWFNNYVKGKGLVISSSGGDAGVSSVLYYLLNLQNLDIELLGSRGCDESGCKNNSQNQDFNQLVKLGAEKTVSCGGTSINLESAMFKNKQFLGCHE